MSLDKGQYNTLDSIDERNLAAAKSAVFRMAFHFDRCRIAKFIPNLIAVRQWTQCGIVYYLRLLYCEFEKYEVMTLSIVRSQPKRLVNPSYKATKTH